MYIYRLNLSENRQGPLEFTCRSTFFTNHKFLIINIHALSLPKGKSTRCICETRMPPHLKIMTLIFDLDFDALH